MCARTYVALRYQMKVLALKGDDSGEGGTTDTLEFPASLADMSRASAKA